MSVSIDIPTLETDRLILRAPRLADAESYIAFKASTRSRFTGGPYDRAIVARNFSGIAGQWILRGYGLFMAATKDDPDLAIGGFGIFHPMQQAEPEFGWSLYDGAFEGRGLVTEAMRAIIPWAWPVMGVDTAQSHVDEGNDGSVAVARALGATFDAETTEAANAPGGELHSEDGPFVHVYRHHEGALT